MSDFITFEQHGLLGLITLDRPQALNAMTAEMATAMHAQLQEWADDDTIAHVAVRGIGKAFCAGGDIRAVYQMRHDAHRFFDPEYDLCRLIHAYPKPYIAVMDGITMGGGVGISIYARHRIATPNTLWAMPECAIGFYPDIGATWFLPRLPGQIGTWLALTGARLKAADLMPLGIATGFAEDEDAFLSLLTSSSAKAEDDVQNMTHLSGNSPVKPADDNTEGGSIDRCFAHDTVEDIIAALEAEGSEWATQTLSTLNRAAPTSLKVTLRLMRLGKSLSFGQAMDLERRMTMRFLDRPDFYEGIRAALIDRDGAPNWIPAELAAVGDADVESYFAP